MSARETFGGWLKQRRKWLDLTQHALAAHSGCSVDTIRKIEAEQRRPSQQLLERLAETLQLPTADRPVFQQRARGHAPAGLCLLPQAPTHAPVDPMPQSPRALPVPLTPLLGRDAQRDALCALIRRPDVRLVTLLGPPGIGKTHLGVQVAADLQETCATDVQFVPLAPLREAQLVLPAMARVLDVHEIGSQPLLEALVSALQGKQLLMVLDNFEQVVAAAPDIAQVLAHAPGLTLLVTSRAALRITGEHLWAVPPLALPDLGHLPPLDVLLEYPAVQLFVQRTLAVHPTFALTEEMAPAVAALCIRLEGVPLALELAAARSRVLSPQALLARLDQRLGLLTDGAVNAPERHQSLRAAIAWSYALLPPEAQARFRQLGVFMGGCTLAAVAAVYGDEAPCSAEAEVPLLDHLTTLVDQSLLQHTASVEGEPRFTMLETLRAYALEQLDAAGEAALVHQRHAAYYVHLAEHAAPHLWGPDQMAWMARLEAEHDNLRAALAWSRTPAGDVILGLRLAAALYEFWYWGGYVSEGRAWLERVLEDSVGVASPLRALVLVRASYFAAQQGDYGQADVLAEAGVTLSRQLHYTAGVALALSVLGMVAYFQADNVLSQERYEESLHLFRELAAQEQITTILDRFMSLTSDRGDDVQAVTYHEAELALCRTVGPIRGMCEVLTGLGFTMLNVREYRHARRLFDEGLALARALRARRSITGALRGLGETALLNGDYTHAAEHYEASLALSRAWGIKMDIAVNLGTMGLVALCQGETGKAATYFMESAGLNRALGRKRGLVYTLAGCASVACLQGQPDRAARLFGAAAALSKRLGHALELTNRTLYDRDVAATRATLGADAFDAAYAAGHALPLDQAMAEALEVVHAAPCTWPAQPFPAKPIYPADLTAREVEVLRLVARGLTNPHIAAHLCISPRTVHAHLRAIYSKLEVTTRSAATRFAVEHGLG